MCVKKKQADAQHCCNAYELFPVPSFHADPVKDGAGADTRATNTVQPLTHLQ